VSAPSGQIADLSRCAVSGENGSPLTARRYKEPDHPYRTPFQRDRDRVLHARAFRRLAGKTQVFTRRLSDHFRSRLTHTIEVTQITRTIAGALRLNEDLAETLALVHDIGHPPFGHAGERVLNAELALYKLRFDHNLHALRIVEYFEQRYAAFRGLNLTLGVREGIIKHSRDYKLSEHPELADYFLDLRPPLEAQLVDLADEIAYLTADLDDGIESGVLKIDHVVENVPLLARYYREMRQQYSSVADKLVFNESLKRMLNELVGDLIRTTSENVAASHAQSLDDIRKLPHRLVAFSQAMESDRLLAKKYLYDTLYESAELAPEKDQAATVIGSLFRHWIANPALLPENQLPNLKHDSLPRVIADYIAGMTDAFIMETYRDQCG